MDMLMFQLQKRTDSPLYRQLYEAIKQAIIEGQIPVGTKLPSKRKLGEFLAISQTTVEQAYHQLAAEGYIEARPRRGFFTQPLQTLAYIDAPVVRTTEDAPVSYRYDFNSAAIDTASFPFTAWRRLAKDLLHETNAELLLSGHPQGDAALRHEIRNYLYQSRGVTCVAEQIVVGSGTEQLLPLLIRLFGSEVVYGYENPGYPLTHSIFDHHDRQSVPLSVDSEGLRIDALEASHADIAYVTPSHQFPTGAVLSALRRTQLLNWAAADSRRFIIEDDYDSEFRYTSRPIPALQSMDVSGRVIYLSTFSKSLMPSLRIAYMVLPKQLLPLYQETFRYYSSSVPRFDQQLVAQFMKDGHFSRHLNRMRKLYEKKLGWVTAALAPFAHAITFSGGQAGMHIVLTVQSALTESELIRRARDAGIRVAGMSAYYADEPPSGPPRIVLGFSKMDKQQTEEGIRQLMACWKIISAQEAHTPHKKDEET